MVPARRPYSPGKYGAEQFEQGSEEVRLNVMKEFAPIADFLMSRPTPVLDNPNPLNIRWS
jgi:hypothetical protein